jgi:hypothetical protein
MARTHPWIVALLVGLACVSVGEAGELKQIQFPHNGLCDDTYHNVPFYTNASGAPIRIAQATLLNGGTGSQGAYLSRRSDNFTFAFSHPEGLVALHSIRAGDALTVAPGDGLNFVHWCTPPDRYGWWVIVDYTE